MSKSPRKINAANAPSRQTTAPAVPAPEYAPKPQGTRGEHRVVVHQVNVSDGGQAIVGSVSPQPARK